MQAHRECLAIRIILLNFTFINHFRTIMKKCADNSNIHAEDKPKHSRQTSKNKEIESYLSTHYDFRFNTVLGRTEFSPKYANVYSKVSRYDINTFRRELDSEEGIITSADNLYSIIESSFSPRINPIQEYFKALPTVDASEVLYTNAPSPILHRALPSVTPRSGCRTLPNGLWQWLPMRWTTVNAVTIPALY